ncbi:hypothetical protein [Streptomyces sp. NBC_01497]|uniref:hypothetical protein n=1 Tax=Streptomyces sp. NBC_01497 TaxID=2903885 RepID=UPI002E35E655|nr:hypothetical protein [Streptomyces sp. NBC_01497]
MPGALGARYSGHLTDRWGPRAVNALSIASALLAFTVFALAGQSLIALVIGCNLLGYGTTSGQIANQARILAVRPEIRARLNTVYIFCVFAGGAAGSAVAGALFSAFGWAGVVSSGLGFLSLAGITLASHALRFRRTAVPTTGTGSLLLMDVQDEARGAPPGSRP